MNRIKVLIIDDSHIIHILLDKVLSDLKDIEIIGNAYDGREGVELTKKLIPDVIIMDIGMPLMDGLEAIQEIMSECPTPVIVFSAANKNMMDLNFRAMELGAVELIEKPFSEDINDLKTIMHNSLVRSIRMFADFKVIRRIKKKTTTSLREEAKRLGTIAEQMKARHMQRQENKPGNEAKIPETASYADDFFVIGIAASTGGPQTIRHLIEDLSGRRINAAIVIVQHMAEGFMQGFCDWLTQYSSIPVLIPHAGDFIKPGNIFIAPGDYHLTFDKKKRFFFKDSPPVHGIRPCADIMFFSLAEVFTTKAIAVILTGMGSDGTRGIFQIKELGGYTIAQDEESSLIYGMPKSAIESGLVDSVLSLSAMPDFIEKFVKERMSRTHDRT